MRACFTCHACDEVFDGALRCPDTPPEQAVCFFCCACDATAHLRGEMVWFLWRGRDDQAGEGR